MAGTRWLSVVAALLLASSCYARTLYATEPALDPNDPTETCADVAEGTIDAPANAKIVAVVEAAGTRNYTCSGGKVKDSFAFANITGDWEGTLYYSAAGVGTFALVDPATGEWMGDVELNKAPTLVPSKTAGTIKDGRWAIDRVTGSAPVVSYLQRTDSTGGAEPAPCDAPEGEWVLVPFTTVYTFLACGAEA